MVVGVSETPQWFELGNISDCSPVKIAPGASGLLCQGDEGGGNPKPQNRIAISAPSQWWMHSCGSPCSPEPGSKTESWGHYQPGWSP